MSISATQLELMHEAGLSINEAIEVARAAECGPNWKAIEVLIQSMLNMGFPASNIGAAALGLARDIVQQDRIASERFKSRILDAASAARDSNRVRRNMPDRQWRELRQQVFERDEHTCTYCGCTDDLTCDHIMPLVRGGGNDLDNLTTACRPCNSSKGDKLVCEWRALA